MTPGREPDFLQERMRPDDPYFNYCYWSYEPVAPGVGKLRPSSLLFHAITQMLESDWLRETVRSIQAGLGDFRSVYGIKQADGQWDLEVYLYDYRRQERALSIERVNASCGGDIQLPTTAGPHVPYFMFSFDLNASVAAAGGRIDRVHVYVGNPGSTVSSGISYGFTDEPDAAEMENVYFFFDAAEHAAIEEKVRCAAFLHDADDLAAQVLRDELRSCRTICLANKRTTNTVYYSEVNVQQLLFFLDWQKYPTAFVEFVRQHQHELDHLLYDVGVDYRIRNGRVEFVKSGIYGVF